MTSTNDETRVQQQRWIAEAGPDEGTYIVRVPDDEIMRLLALDTPEGYEAAADVDVRNMRTLETAPDLLAALEMVEAEITGTYVLEHAEGDCGSCDATRMVRAAIRRARGEAVEQ